MRRPAPAPVLHRRAPTLRPHAAVCRSDRSAHRETRLPSPRHRWPRRVFHRGGHMQGCPCPHTWSVRASMNATAFTSARIAAACPTAEATCRGVHSCSSRASSDTPALASAPMAFTGPNLFRGHVQRRALMLVLHVERHTRPIEDR
eukprot:scaffold7114_cov67-Phaeocystis_antarctica.AAC.4